MSRVDKSTELSLFATCGSLQLILEQSAVTH